MPEISIPDLYTLFQKHPEICTDTRKIISGSLFFALRGEKFNGNSFAEKAISEGAAYAIVDDPSLPDRKEFLKVPDALKALQDLARMHRSMLTIPFIGITGSNGKTSTKEITRDILSTKYKTFATQGNLNNHIGVPISILSIKEDIEIAVIEMGANHIGEIAFLSEIARPDYGLITNIGKAHLEGFGGIEGVKTGKSELYQYIEKHSGKIFVNRDNATLTGLIKTADTQTYGTSGPCNILGRLISEFPKLVFRWKSNKDAETLDEKENIETRISGSYNLENVLAGICIADYFSVSARDINEAVKNYIPGNMRSEEIKTKRNQIFLDAYNANPSSMEKAIKHFSGLEGNSKLAVLGDMLELGDYAEEEHKAIIELLRQSSISEAILIGPVFSKVYKSKKGEKVRVFENTDAALKSLKPELKALKGKMVLVKGSRGLALENLSSLL